MKDVNKKIMFIMWAVVAVFFVVLLTTRKTTAQKSDGDFSFNFNIGVDFYQNTTTFSDQDATRIVIDLVTPDVVIKQTDGNDIVVDVSGSDWDVETKPEVKLEGKTLYVTNETIDDKSASSRDKIVCIQIPRRMMNTFFDAEIGTVSGSIESDGINYNTFVLGTVSGDIEADGFFRSATCASVSGDVTIEAEKPLMYDSQFSTVSGDISLTLPAESSFSLTTGSVFGNLRNDFADGTTVKNGVFSTGTGDPEIVMSNVSGKISILKD